MEGNGRPLADLARRAFGLNGPAPGAGDRRAPPRAPEPYRPFPVEQLPRALARLAEGASAAIGCDPAYPALFSLAACAGAVGNTRSVLLKRRWAEPCILWTVVVGESGTLKTPPYKLALAPLHAAQKEWREAHELELVRFKEQHEAFREAKRSAGDDPPGREPKRPPLRRCCCLDVTIERLVEVLEDNPRGLLVSRDELRGWFGSFTRYKAQLGSTDVPNWLELYTAGVAGYDRKTGDRRSVVVDRASVSVTGGIQPGTLARALTPDYFESGLVARLLMAWPPRRKKAWTEAEIPEDVEDGYQALVRRLLALAFYKNAEGKEMPYRVRLSEDAKRLWVAFYNEWAEEQASAEGELAALYSKIEGTAPRLALLHHVVSHVDCDSDDRRDLGPASMRAGVALARWFASESRRIYQALRESDEEAQTRRLLEWVRLRGGRVTPRDLQRSNARRWPSAEMAEAALEDFVQAGLGRWEDGAVPSGGGPRPRFFVLDPALCPTSDNPTNASAGEREAPDKRPPAPPGEEAWPWESQGK